MDLNDYWQENRRFVLTVAGGLVAFLVGELLIGSFFGKDLAAKRGEITRTRSDLAKSRFGPQQLSEARAENERLQAAADQLVGAMTFDPRSAFVLDPAGGTPGNQYFARVQEVRDRVARAAARANVRIQPDLGLPALAPTRQEEIVRYLEGLDLVERVCEAAIEFGVGRVERIEIRLDPTLFATRQSGPLEKTRVKMRMVGRSGPLAQLAVATQDPARGASLLIDELEMVPERNKVEEAVMEVTFAIVRLRNLEAPPTEV